MHATQTASSKQQAAAAVARSLLRPLSMQACKHAMQADKTSAKTVGAVEISGLFGAAHTCAHRQPILSTHPTPHSDRLQRY
jgi:hypothetical protein